MPTEEIQRRGPNASHGRGSRSLPLGSLESTGHRTALNTHASRRTHAKGPTMDASAYAPTNATTGPLPMPGLHGSGHAGP